MQLTPRQKHALESICETFFPSSEGWPSAVELGVPDALAEALEFNPRTRSGAQFLNLVDVCDANLHAFLLAGEYENFSKLEKDVREKVLRSWADSSLQKRRAAFQALRRAIGFLYVTLPGGGGGVSPVLGKIRYPGPLGVQRPQAGRVLKVIAPEKETTLTCDVCVIGSGSGGGVAAGELAAAGKDIVVLEAGNYYDDADFDGAELAGFQRLYVEGGFAGTQDQSVGILAGECLGGGTVVNYCTSFRTPDDIRSEWAEAGARWIAGAEYTRSLDAVCERLHVNREHNCVSAREQALERGLRALGWHVDRMPRNVTECEQGKICGYCGYGCAIGAKQSATKTWLADAQAKGARFVVGTRAERVRIEAGAATGVEAVSKGGHRVSVKCKTVVVACGAIHTAALLLRSGLGNEHIGRHLHLHPVSNVFGIFEEEIRPWEGTMQAIYSDEFRQMTGNYGVKFETTALQPVIAMAPLAWRNPEQCRELMEKFGNTSAIGVLLRDRHGGRVKIDSEGNPVSHYSVSEFDRAHLRRGFLGAAQILEAAGAKMIYSPHAKFCSYEPGKRGSIQTFEREMDRAGWDNGEVSLFSFHIMGTARLGDSPAMSATNPDGETWEVRNLFVMDGASFPSASGVNPMISIEAIAHRNARALAAKLTSN